MTDTPEFLSAAPVLLTRDLSRTADFYTQHLGFAIVSLYPNYLILRRGAVALHFSLAADLDPKTNPCTTYVYLTGVREFYEQCQAEGVLRHNAWRGDQDYGMRDFSLVDPDGNLLTFGEALPPR
ncbi:MAG: VOC family protein [Chloroflexi bacterium]|nr:VOC family protein [Chloroflexota bacterium]